MVLLAMATRAKHLKTASSVPVPGGWDEEQSGQASEGGPIVKIKSVRLEWLMVLSCPRLMNKTGLGKRRRRRKNHRLPLCLKIMTIGEIEVNHHGRCEGTTA